MKLPHSEQLLSFTLVIAFILGWFLSSGLDTFFNQKGVMDQQQTIPSMQPIGFDLFTTVNLTKEKSPYVDKNYAYTPFVQLAFTPLTLLSPKAAYSFFTLLTILGLISSIFLLDRLIQKKTHVSILIVFFLITSFFSYGLHFELERGQFNVTALALAIIGVVLFMKQKKLLGLLLLTLSIQLKIYPAILLLLLFFLDTQYKRNMQLIVATIICNALFLFIYGGHYFNQFVNALIYQMKNPYMWIGNHSLASYCSGVSHMSLCTKQSYPLFLALYFIILGIAVVLRMKSKNIGYNVYIFTLSGLGMVLIPSASHDYTLSLLAIIIFPFCKELYLTYLNKKNMLNLSFFALTIFLYTLTLFSAFYASPFFLFSENKAPVLYSLVLITFAALLMSHRQANKQT